MYYKKYVKGSKKESRGDKKEVEIIRKGSDYLEPIMGELSQQIDKRLTYTFFDTFFGILSHRDQINGLLLSELGGYINGPEHAPAGTKRLSNLLACEGWDDKLLQDQLLKKNQQRLSKKGEEGKRWLLHWDDSVIEKPESFRTEGLCAVVSSKASRLTRIKPGYYKKIGRISVPGYEWSACVLSSLQDPPAICLMNWWTKRGKHAEQKDNILYRMLQSSSEMIKQTQAEVWHIFDRGYANFTTLNYMINHFEQQFIVRWKSNHKLINQNGISKNTYRHSLGKKATTTRFLWDKERKENRKVSLVHMPVRHPEEELNSKQLYLVIARDGIKGRKPIYFLTDVKVDTNGMAWSIVLSYMRRWDVEQIFRFGKTAMGIESPRLWFFDRTLKLLSFVTLIMDFLFSLIAQHRSFARTLIDKWCPRTGNRQRKTSLPIYRLRLAVSLILLYRLNPFFDT